MCVDDNSDILEVMEGYLESYYNVVTFTDTSEALLYLKHFNCDLLILDIFMPQIDGLKFIGELKEIQKFTGKILMCTGGGESGPFVGGLAIDAALNIGACGGLMKPFSKGELIAKVQSILRF